MNFFPSTIIKQHLLNVKGFRKSLQTFITHNRCCFLSCAEFVNVSHGRFALPHKPNLSLPPGEMSRSDREGWYQLTWLFKFALIRTCPLFALSVICSANASSPKGRAEKPVRTAHLTHQANSCADLFAYCSFRHGLRRATFLRKEGFFSYVSMQA